MRVRHNTKPICRDFSTHQEARGIVAEFDVSPHPRCTLHAKVLVFTSTWSLTHFYRYVLGIRTLYKGGSLGVVGCVVQTGSQVGYGDPRRPGCCGWRTSGTSA